MLQGWVVIAVALAYIGLLFAVASYGDRAGRAPRGRARAFIYPLSLAIYCTSWTFFGSVGLASRNGLEFLTIYVGPVLVLGLCYPLIMRIVRLAKAHNITSIADFIAARYGKSQAVAATVALIAIIGTVPYIALQLKALSSALATILTQIELDTGAPQPMPGDLPFLVALALATFAVLFGTRHTDATEHQEGLMLAIATESIVKLVAFLAAGIFVTFVIFDGPHALFAAAMERADTRAVLTREPQYATLITMTLLSGVAIILLPRQFHVTVVENNGPAEVRRAAWMLPLYLVAINIFVLPIALAGMLLYPIKNIDPDMFVLAVPLTAHDQMMTLVVFVGGLSAATAMVIVESVALAIMVSNDLVMPFVLKRRQALVEGSSNVGALLLRIRRVAIFVILLLAYVYYRSAGDAQLAAIGLLSFAAIAQFAPAFFGGLIWRRATARGAIAGMTVGVLVWAYTLLLPSFVEAGLIGGNILADGAFGVPWLRPQALLFADMPPLVHGVFWSLALNIIAYVGFSLSRQPTAIERTQTSLFVQSESTPNAPSFRLWRSAVTVEELTHAVARYLGDERTRSSFQSFAAMQRVSLEPGHEADIHLVRYAEHLLASAIGAASSRLVLSLLLRKRLVSTSAALRLLDDANAAIHYNREVLQTALEHVRQGIAVFDKDLRLMCWNQRFGEIIDVPPGCLRIGAGLPDILRALAMHDGAAEPAALEASVARRLQLYASTAEPFRERFAGGATVIEVRSNRMPDAGIVMTFTDVTASVDAAEVLERANETLERRVRERTEELLRLNGELASAKAQADEANLSKTRFLAAASHDILQPLNAARLYVSSLVERTDKPVIARPEMLPDRQSDRQIVASIDASLESVEEILGALLEISRLDAGALTAEPTVFPIGDLLRQLELEFAPLARAKGLDFTFVGSSLSVRSDRRLLRRLLQNLISNAVKYTPRGRVLVGCRRRGKHLRINIHDTGIGIAESQRRMVFKEFHRLDPGARVARGLGLGLSIVERIGRVLGHPVDMRSASGRGSHFWVDLPLVAAAIRPHPAAARRPVDGQLDGLTVLCIDNEPRILQGLETLLGGWGATVVTAPDLANALTTLARRALTPHGLLVDYHLDDGDGIQAVAALRRTFGDVPAILVTADGSPAVREAARQHGIKLMNKPAKPAALRALLARWRIQHAAAAE